MTKFHGERGSLLRKMEREDLNAICGDVMKTLYDEAFHEIVQFIGKKV